MTVSFGGTKNMGNFESARVDVGISLPFDAAIHGDYERAYEEARAWTSSRVQEELAKLSHQ